MNVTRRKLLRSPILRLLPCALCFCLVSACVETPRKAPRVPVDHLTVAHASQSNRQAPNALSINHASKNELERLPGIGPALASRIVEHRERYGPFRRIEHLLMVRGIGEQRFRQLRPHIEAEPTTTR